MNGKIQRPGQWLALLLSLAFIPRSSAAIAEDYDVIIKDTTIIDGTGRASFRGNLAVRGERIATVGRVRGQARIVIDGSGLITCPGFIDPHSHADLSLMQYPLCENLAMQGITTFLGGNCGESSAPQETKTFGEWLRDVERTGISVNYAPLVGHHPLRKLALGDDNRRRATAGEIEKMKELLAEAVENGAFGLSLGLDPGPGHFADMEELTALAGEIKKRGGLLDAHTRGVQSQWATDNPREVSYGIFCGPVEDAFVGMYRGYVEILEIARRTGVRLNIAHLDNAYMQPQPHPDFLDAAGARATLDSLIAAARDEGLDISFDIIAYDANISGKERMYWGLFSKSPALNWVYQIARRSKGDYIARLGTKEFRVKIRRTHEAGRLKLGMIHTKAWPYWMDYFRILSCRIKGYEGKTIGEIARLRGTDALEAIFDIILEDPDTIWIQHVDPRLPPEAIPVLMTYPYAMPCTDAQALPAVLQDDFEVSPAAYGLYPHYIRRYVKERRVLSLEEAVRKATSLPAQVVGLRERGVLTPGNFADILVFDYVLIKDTAEPMDPDQRPEGIRFVLVNGEVVFQDGIHTGRKPGKVLRNDSELRRNAGGR
ncbi:MAG TPA: amidohydrolase family protein [Acidobacteriota bacterium]|nr:amidohydrolase family protein [Acidobacteriota bacterium]